ncbi:MAG TPA: hypothetical protein VIU43_03385, partial [Nitrosospira sp.]
PHRDLLLVQLLFIDHWVNIASFIQNEFIHFFDALKKPPPDKSRTAYGKLLINGQIQIHIFMHRMRRPNLEMAGSVPALPGVEYAGRGNC